VAVPHFEELSFSLSRDQQTGCWFIPEQVFGQALDALVITCVDLMILCDRQLLLAKRNRLPRTSWWVVGGRMFPGESPIQTAQRKAQDEAGLNLERDRFRFVGVYSTVFAQRAQPPQANGLHSVNLTFSVELSAIEKAQVALTDAEYESWRWVDRAQVLPLLDQTQPMDRCLERIIQDLTASAR
jgi:ADP-ribose pyrophosphatase YjhB (NUDIX family)